MDIPADEIVTWVVICIIVLSTTIGAVRKIHPFVKKFTNFMDDWIGEPERPGVESRPGVMERLHRLENLSLSTNYHVRPNHGGSSHDELVRKVDQIATKIESGR